MFNKGPRNECDVLLQGKLNIDVEMKLREMSLASTGLFGPVRLAIFTSQRA